MNESFFFSFLLFHDHQNAGISMKHLLKSLLLEKLAAQKRPPLHAGKSLYLLNW